MEIWQIALVYIVGTIAGFVNTLAGGGSLLTLPTLIFLGLPGPLANGTNRVAIMIQNIFAVAGFRSKGVSNIKFGLFISVAAVAGAIIGAQIAVDISDSAFRKVLAVIMIMVVTLIIWNPTRRLKGTEQNLIRKRKILSFIAFFFVGIYGGFIQAGVGFIIMATLVLITGFDLVMTNSVKVFVVGIYTAAALIIFIINGQVNWTFGLLLSAGNATGGWIGSHFAVSKGEKWIKIILVIAVLVMSLKLLGVIPEFNQ